MPGFDRTGPAGQGPRTGRGMGKCGRVKRGKEPDSGQSFNASLDTERPMGRGAGRRRGTTGGRGQGRCRGPM